MQITKIEELPKCERYVMGWDLHLSGWGPFAFPDQPNRLESMTWEEYTHSPPARTLCPVVYLCPAGTDTELLKFNMWRCDCVYRDEESNYGLPQRKMPLSEQKKLVADLAPFKHSIVGGFIAGLHLQGYSRSGMHQYVHWIIQTRKHPFIVVRDPVTCSRWYTDPGLGWTFYDKQEQPYKFCHPRDPARKGDFALVDDRVQLQNYTYRGRFRRYKVLPVEEAA